MKQVLVTAVLDVMGSGVEFTIQELEVYTDGSKKDCAAAIRVIKKGIPNYCK